MMRRHLVLMAIALVAIALLAAACGGDDDDGTNGNNGVGEIQTERGLGVAFALQAGERAQDRASGDEEGDGSAAPGAPSGVDAASRSASAAYAFSNDGLTVTGYGMASTAADSAILELYFSTTAAYPREDDGGSGSSPGAEPDSQTAPTVAGISLEDLQPVIDALVAAGVDADDIEYVGGSYYDPYYASATLRVTVTDVDRLGDLMNVAADAAASLSDIYLQGSYVSYTISDCAALEAAALEEAVNDADARATALASAAGVTRGALTGASSDAYSPWGGTACSGGYVGPYPVGGVVYAEGQPSQVQVYASVSVTYAIQ
jgi:uncharacterized protein YggE